MIRNWAQSIMRLAFYLAVIFSIGSCVVVPLELPEERLFREGRLEFITPGETTAAEIRAAFNQIDELDVRGPYRLGDNWWQYSSTRDLGKAFVAIAIATLGGGVVDAGIAEWGERESTLLLRFNDRDVVEEYGVIYEGSLCDRVHRICYVEGQVIRQADPNTEAVAESFEQSPGGCGLYVYREVYRATVSVYLNSEWIGDFFSDNNYYYRTVEPGMHRITTYRSLSETTYYETGLFECADGELVFVRIGGQGIGQRDMVLGVVNERTGRRAVLERYLTVVEPLGTTRPPRRLKFIMPGESTKEDIRTAFANAFPGPYEAPGGDWWAYDVGQVSGEALLVNDPFLERALQSRLDLWSGQVPQESALLLRIDSNDVLAEYEQVDEGRPCVSAHRICYAKGGRFQRLADQETERAVKRTELPSGQCGLYVYLDYYSMSSRSISIYLDGIRVFPNLFSESMFYYRPVEPGTHTVTVEPPPLNPPVSFECIDDELFFVRIGIDLPGRWGMSTQGVRTRLMSLEQGLRSVRLRQLAMDSPVEP